MKLFPKHPAQRHHLFLQIRSLENRRIFAMLKHFVAVEANLAGRRRARSGQSLAEYGLILALVAVFCITALQLLGGNIQSMINQLAGSIQNATP
jgi:pilus assembly protein Flp/PilA